MLLLVAIILIGCGKKVEIDRRIESFMELYNEKWKNYSIKDAKLKKQVSKLLSSNDFKVIWNWDTDADGVIEYFCIISDKKIKKAITKGVLIDTNGKIKLVFDVNKGIYTKDYYVYDFKKMGIKQNEVKCIRLLFINKYQGCTIDDIKEASKSLRLGQKRTLHRYLSFQFIDHNDQLVGTIIRTKYRKLLKSAKYAQYAKHAKYQMYEMFPMEISILVRPLAVKYIIMNPMREDEKIIYQWFRKMVKVYRKSIYKTKAYND